MRLGDGDLGDRDRLTERERVSDRGVTERRGDTECAERGRVSDLVRDLSREGLRVRERAGDGERDGMSWLSRNFSRSSVLLRALQCTLGGWACSYFVGHV